MATKEFVIASNSDKSRLELQLDNLKMLLLIQEEKVRRTKEEIKDIEEQIKREKSL